MTNLEKGREFERKIYRFYKLIEKQGADVQWNVKVRDPDSPEVFRQIDIEIKRGDKKTHVECRDRRKPQDSMWIEELAGRQISLGADAIIGVSASGFTLPAVKKAARLGVVLKDLKDVNDEDVKNWGVFVELYAQYCVFENPVFYGFFYPDLPVITSDDRSVLMKIKREGLLDHILNIFNFDCERRVSKEKLLANGVLGPLQSTLFLDNYLQIENNKMYLLGLVSKFKRVEYKIQKEYSVLFGSANVSTDQKDLLSERFENSSSEVNRTKTAMSASLNMDALEHPKNHMLTGLRYVGLKNENMPPLNLLINGIKKENLLSHLDLDFRVKYELISEPEGLDEFVFRIPKIDVGYRRDPDS